MPRMSYCRFENTLNGLQDCLNALEDEGMATLKSASSYEKQAAEDLLYTAKRFIEAYETARSEAEAEAMGLLPE